MLSSLETPNFEISWKKKKKYHVEIIGGSKGGGQEGYGPPQRPDKNDKIAHFCSILHYLKKIFPGGMPPDPHNSLICSVFLALAAAGPRQCERLEPPVVKGDP